MVILPLQTTKNMFLRSTVKPDSSDSLRIKTYLEKLFQFLLQYLNVAPSLFLVYSFFSMPRRHIPYFTYLLRMPLSVEILSGILKDQ
ncbi:hypothetical protein HERIO_325 [Hepatospora eriocheir]|uniref:Uncharacterized protein n=1 Tax=Hepatospora eriocheir TaxID=1081669 RepID=A0A1X0QDI5_9MICR|nr:hypothetical protein HERIO_325 [Hepatospora eriocheir]